VTARVVDFVPSTCPEKWKLAENDGFWRSVRVSPITLLNRYFVPFQQIIGISQYAPDPSEKREVTGSTPVPTTRKSQFSGGFEPA